MTHIASRPQPLTSSEIQDFITNHLPYRLKILNTVVTYPNKVNSDKYWPSIYESAQITCRMLLQFLGLKINKDLNDIVSSVNYYSYDNINSYEVKIVDLGFPFINPEDISLEKRAKLAHAYLAGSKATAHLTHQTQISADPNKVIEASIIISELIKKTIQQ